MMKKINALCFIFLILFLISAVSAADSENETAPTINSNEIQEIQKTSEECSAELISAKEVDNEKLQASNSIKTSKVTKEKVILKGSNVNMYYKDGSKFTVNLKDKNKKVLGNAKVKITISGATYTKVTDKKGNAYLNLNLKSGKYIVLTTFDGTNKYEKANVKNTVIIKSTIKNSDLKKIYKNPTPYSSTFYDKKGKVLKNTVVKFKISGKTYSAKTNNKGLAKLNINLNPGKYSITSINSKTSESITKNIIITPLIIGNNDLTKYYKNSKEFSVKLITPYGKSVGGGKQVVFNIKGTNYKKTTDKNGNAKININLNPGTYTLKTSYNGCSVTNKITIKSLIESKDLTMKESDGSKFNAKIYNSQGKVVANQKVAFKINSKTYTAITDKNGIASLNINLEPGKYNIITEYGGLKSTNKITVNKVIKQTQFKHTTLVPNYVNVTVPFAFTNSVYTAKFGFNGIVKMPKTEIFTIRLGEVIHQFTTNPINGADFINIGYKSHLISFDGKKIQSEINKENLKGEGILISKVKDYTQIEYISKTSDNIELFGFYADRGLDKTETLTYMQNDKVTALINIETVNYDELGLKYSLSRYYGKTIYTINYNEIPKDAVKFTNSQEPVTYSYFGSYVAAGFNSDEDIITKFSVNQKEELTKHETISYGLGKTYRSTMGFEVLQSYAIINEKVNKNIMNNWISKSPNYLNRFGIMNVYGMFLASLETTWLADELANSYSGEYKINWKRGNTLTILGGINLKDTYLHILNADMGMVVTGASEKNIMAFKLLNSLCLPYLEDYSLRPITDVYHDNSTNSLDNILSSVSRNFSTVKLGDMLYIFGDDKKSAAVLNCTSGVVNVIYNDNDFTYKGSKINTTGDCCIICTIQNKIMSSINELTKSVSPLQHIASDSFNNIYPYTRLAHLGATYILGKTLTGLSQASLNIFTFMSLIQAGGSYYRDNILDQKDWYSAMDTFTFTRPGYFQNKKVYNIPNENGGYDYVEVNINNDLTLDRDSAIYISNGNTKELSRSETYEYFTEEYWTPFSMPEKYWDGSWKR